MVVVQQAKLLHHQLDWFDVADAPVIADWVASDQDLLWLAPGTVPPLTASKMVSWRKTNGFAFCYRIAEQQEPIGYGELNPMRRDRTHYWLGHVLIDPAWRGRRLGQQFTNTLLAYSFNCLNAHMVSLIVFPGNASAIACYRRVGFIEAGEEFHAFGRFAQPLRLLRMQISRDQFAAKAVNR